MKKWLMTGLAATLLALALTQNANAQFRFDPRFPGAGNGFPGGGFPGYRPPVPVGFPVDQARCGRVDQLALRLERQAREVLRETRSHFGYDRRFRHLEADAFAMLQLADHIHDVASRHGNLFHLRRDVERLDVLFHHVEELVDDLAQRCRIDRQGLFHLRADLARMGRTLHQLRAELF